MLILKVFGRCHSFFSKLVSWLKMVLLMSGDVEQNPGPNLNHQNGVFKFRLLFSLLLFYPLTSGENEYKISALNKL
jgi:hypothetical protein